MGPLVSGNRSRASWAVHGSSCHRSTSNDGSVCCGAGSGAKAAWAIRAHPLSGHPAQLSLAAAAPAARDRTPGPPPADPRPGARSFLSIHRSSWLNFGMRRGLVWLAALLVAAPCSSAGRGPGRHHRSRAGHRQRLPRPRRRPASTGPTTPTPPTTATATSRWPSATSMTGPWTQARQRAAHPGRVGQRRPDLGTRRVAAWPTAATCSTTPRAASPPGRQCLGAA